MRTFVSISGCGYLIAQSSSIGERQTEMYSSPNAPPRPSLPQRPDSTHSSLKVPNWTSSVYPHISAATRFRAQESRQSFPTDLFQSRKDPTSGPQSFKKPSLDQRRRISKHQKATTNTSYSSNEPKKRYQFSTAHFQSSIHNPPCKTPILYTSINTPTPSYHPYLTPSAQITSGKPTQL